KSLQVLNCLSSNPRTLQKYGPEISSTGNSNWAEFKFWASNRMEGTPETGSGKKSLLLAIWKWYVRRSWSSWSRSVEGFLVNTCGALGERGTRATALRESRPLTRMQASPGFVGRRLPWFATALVPYSTLWRPGLRIFLASLLGW